MGGVDHLNQRPLGRSSVWRAATPGKPWLLWVGRGQWPRPDGTPGPSPTPKGVKVRPGIKSVYPHFLPSTTHRSGDLPRPQSCTAALRLPCAPAPVALSPLLSGGQTRHFSPPSGAGAVSGRVGKPAKQGGQSLNRLDGAVTSPPRSWVSLLAHRTEAEASRDKHFITLRVDRGLWKVGAGGGVVPESPGSAGGVQQLRLRVPGQAKLGLIPGGRGSSSKGQRATFHSSLIRLHSVK